MTESFNFEAIPVRIGGDGRVEVDVTVEVSLVSRSGKTSAVPAVSRKRLLLLADTVEEILVTDVGVAYTVLVALGGPGGSAIDRLASVPADAGKSALEPPASTPPGATP